MRILQPSVSADEDKEDAADEDKEDAVAAVDDDADLAIVRTSVQTAIINDDAETLGPILANGLFVDSCFLLFCFVYLLGLP